VIKIIFQMLFLEKRQECEKARKAGLDVHAISVRLK